MHIVFIGLPLSGHINPTLETVRELVKRGHRVTYPTTLERVQVIEETGASAPIFMSTFGPETPVPGPAEWMTHMRLAMLHETSTIMPQLQRILRDDVPDLIVYDRAAFAARIVAALLKRPTVQYVPTFAANEHWQVTQRHAPVDTNTPAFQAYQQRLKDVLHGYDLVPDDLPVFRRQISFIPKAFQYRAETFDHRTVFVGPSLRPASGEWSPPTDGKRVLLVAMGTMGTATVDFYRRCAQSFDDSWHVIMSIGDRVSARELGPLPAHVQARASVPQLDILRHAKALICHGGMGSTMEALHFGVPTVQVPTTPEQVATADRVDELGLGVRIAVTTSPREAVDRVVSDELMAQRIRLMQAALQACGGSREAADVIEGVTEGLAPPG